MVFGGLQKFTLLDYPGKTACTVFTSGCNFTCPFCHNASLIGIDNNESRESRGTGVESRGTGVVLSCKKAQHLSPCFQHLSPCFFPVEFLSTRQGLLDGVCISGGEPLMQEDLESFIDEIKELGYLVKLDTNGSFPEKLERLIAAKKIDYVAMDIKNSREKYAQTIGVPEYDISPVEESIEILCNNTIPYEFRTTVVKEFHTIEDLLSIAVWLSRKQRDGGCASSASGKYFLQKFIDSENVKQKGLHGYSDAEMRLFINEITTILPFAELRGV